MKKHIVTALLLAAFSLSAYGDKVISSYQFNITSEDLYNSQGKKLKTFGEVVQQDRANYHKFGKADKEVETNCHYFTTAEKRATIPALVKASNMGGTKVHDEDWMNEALIKAVIIKTDDGKIKMHFELIAG